MKRKYLSLIIISIIITLLFNGCVEKKVNSSMIDSKTRNYIVYNIEKFPEDLLQLSSGSNRDKDLLLSLFEGLVRMDEDGKIVPGIAESFSEGKDNITYTFKLRENTKWSDGKQVLATDFVVFFKDILNPKQKNNYASQLYYIFGAEDYNKGKKSFNGVAIRAIDDKTLEIRLNSPTSWFLQILSQPIYTLRKIDTNLKEWKTAYSKISYTGPFKLENIDKETELTLTKNNNYYGKDEVKSERIYLTSINGSENAMANFKTGKINLFVNPPVSENKNLILSGEEESIPINIGWSLNFNLKKSGIVNDIDFRRALNLAIDREQIATDALSNVARVATSYVPIEEALSTQVLKEKEYLKENKDISQSKKLLLNSKYNKKESVKFVYLNNNDNKRIADAIAKDLQEDLDISLDYKGYSEIELEDILKNGDYNIVLREYSSLYNDPISILESWLSTSKVNTFGYNNSQYDDFILKAKLEKDKQKRTEYLQKAEAQLLSDMPNIPICFQNIILCRRPEIKGVYTLKEGNIMLDKAYMDISNFTQN